MSLVAADKLLLFSGEAQNRTLVIIMVAFKMMHRKKRQQSGALEKAILVQMHKRHSEFEMSMKSIIRPHRATRQPEQNPGCAISTSNLPFNIMDYLRLKILIFSYCIFGSKAFIKSPKVPTRNKSPLEVGPQQLGEFEVLGLDDPTISERKVALIDYSSSPSTIPFKIAWKFQKEILDGHVERMMGKDDNKNQFLKSDGKATGIDTVIMLQHDAVYTLGTGSDENFVLGINEKVPVVRMDRGGEVTYHGPGQLTVYPVFDLRGYRQDIHWYMRALEEAILLALTKCGLDRAERQEDVTGVWVDNFKVAACGVKVKRWVTMHGLAVNVEIASLENFEGIVPCGLDGRKVSCVNQFVDEPLTVADFAGLMKEALEEVFEIRLIPTEQELPASAEDQ